MTRTILTRRILLGTLCLSIAVAVLSTVMLAVPTSEPSRHSSLNVGGELVLVTVADTPDLRAKGLSGNKGLLQNEGMLFVFPTSGLHSFWMKDMLFPIDIIWFDEDKRIIDVWENALPESYPKAYTPVLKAKYVLEVNEGFYKQHNLKVGDVLEFESSSIYNK